jgi:uncharacterized protein YecA (UPF0149 family)
MVLFKIKITEEIDMNDDQKKEIVFDELNEPVHVHGPNCNHHHHHHSIKPIERTSPKIGRNDPCICGSGQKYKKCCSK